MAEAVTGAQSLIMSLEAAGAEVVFGLPGGAILPTYDPLLDAKGLRHILVRHEQGAGHAASGYAHATGKVGVCIATSGPGATNLITAIADAQMDSIPMVVITGQVGSSFIGTDAFQEADIVGMTMPVTKHNILVKNADDIPLAIKQAFHIASTGRPGVVLVDVTKDAQQAKPFSTGPKSSIFPATGSPGARTASRSAKRSSCSSVRSAPCSSWAVVCFVRARARRCVRSSKRRTLRSSRPSWRAVPFLIRTRSTWECPECTETLRRSRLSNAVT